LCSQDLERSGPRRVQSDESAALPGPIEILEGAWRRGELSLATLQRVHHQIADIPVGLGGRLRDGAAIVRLNGRVWFVPPPAAEARHRAGLFVARLAKDLAPLQVSPPPLLLAALAIARLTDLHPFSDGNGRVARAVATWLLYRSGYQLKLGSSLDEFFHSHERESYRALRRHDEDPQTWTEFFRRAASNCFSTT
jgi:Fic family protein